MPHTLGTVSQFISELSGFSFITGSNQQRPWFIVGSWAMLLTTRDQFQREDDDGCREVTLAESTLYFIDYHTKRMLEISEGWRWEIRKSVAAVSVSSHALSLVWILRSCSCKDPSLTSVSMVALLTMNSFHFVTLETLVLNIWAGGGQGSNMSMTGEHDSVYNACLTRTRRGGRREEGVLCQHTWQILFLKLVWLSYNS